MLQFSPVILAKNIALNLKLIATEMFLYSEGELRDTLAYTKNRHHTTNGKIYFWGKN
jgi:hypothetical protein